VAGLCDLCYVHAEVHLVQTESSSACRPERSSRSHGARASSCATERFNIMRVCAGDDHAANEEVASSNSSMADLKLQLAVARVHALFQAISRSSTRSVESAKVRLAAEMQDGVARVIAWVNTVYMRAGTGTICCLQLTRRSRARLAEVQQMLDEIGPRVPRDGLRQARCVDLRYDW
jgi:hypothetical protein